MPKYWRTSDVHCHNGVDMEFRSDLAWELLRHFGLVAGHTGREDSTGRAVLDIMPASEAVARAFAIADLFVETAESRGDIRPYTDEDAAKSFAMAGTLSRERSKAEYPRAAKLAELAEEAKAGS
jgi:hypothetical protein